MSSLLVGNSSTSSRAAALCSSRSRSSSLDSCQYSVLFWLGESSFCEEVSATTTTRVPRSSRSAPTSKANSRSSSFNAMGHKDNAISYGYGPPSETVFDSDDDMASESEVAAARRHKSHSARSSFTNSNSGNSSAAAKDGGERLQQLVSRYYQTQNRSRRPSNDIDYSPRDMVRERDDDSINLPSAMKKPSSVSSKQKESVSFDFSSKPSATFRTPASVAHPDSHRKRQDQRSPSHSRSGSLTRRDGSVNRRDESQNRVGRSNSLSKQRGVGNQSPPPTSARDSSQRRSGSIRPLIPVMRKKVSEPDLISRIIRDSSTNPPSLSTNGSRAVPPPQVGSGVEESPASGSAYERVDIPQPENYGVHRRSDREASLRNVPVDYENQPSLRAGGVAPIPTVSGMGPTPIAGGMPVPGSYYTSAAAGKDLGRWIGNSSTTLWRWLTRGPYNRYYPGSEGVYQPSIRSRGVSAGPVATGAYGEPRTFLPLTPSGRPLTERTGYPFLDLITNMWIGFLSRVPSLSFLLGPIAMVSEGPMRIFKLPVIFVEIFVVLWLLYYVLVIIEGIFTIIKAICSPVIFITNSLIGNGSR